MITFENFSFLDAVKNNEIDHLIIKKLKTKLLVEYDLTEDQIHTVIKTIFNDVDLVSMINKEIKAALKETIPNLQALIDKIGNICQFKIKDLINTMHSNI